MPRLLASLAFSALALFVLAFLAGCPGPTFIVQQYPGAVRPRESIATLRVNGSDAVRLLILDDEDVNVPIPTDARLHIELLPGRHRMIVGNANAPQERLPPIAFDAEAGKVYRVVIAPGAPAHVFEVDREQDTPARDATLQRRSEDHPPPDDVRDRPAPLAPNDGGAADP